MERKKVNSDLDKKYQKYFILKIYQENGETTIKSSKKSKGFTPTEILGTITRLQYELNVILDKNK